MEAKFSCSKQENFDEPKEIFNPTDEFNSKEIIEPYLKYINAPRGSVSLHLNEIEPLVTPGEYYELTQLFNLKLPGSSTELQLTAANRDQLYYYFEQLHYRSPVICINTISEEKAEVQVLKEPLYPRACPKAERKCQYLRFTLQFDCAEYEDSNACVAGLLGQLPPWERCELQDLVFHNYRSARGKAPIVQYVFVPQRCNLYPFCVLCAAERLHVAVGDFEYTDFGNASLVYSVLCEGIAHKSELQLYNGILGDFRLQLPYASDAGDLTYTLQQIGVELINKAYLTALKMCVVVSYEEQCGEKLSLVLQNAFNFVKNAVKAKYAKYALAGSILRYLASEQAEIERQGEEYNYCNVLLQHVAACRQIAQSALNQINNQYFLAINTPGYVRRGDAYVLASGSMNSSQKYPYLGQNFSQIFQNQLNDPPVKLLEQIMQRNGVIQKNMTLNELLSSAGYREIIYTPQDVQFSCCKGEQTFEYQKYEEVEWQGQAGTKSIAVRFALQGCQLDEDEAISSTIRQGHLQVLL